MKRLHLHLRHRVALFAACAAALAGCAGMQTDSSCPDLGGTYDNQAERSGERLSTLLLANRPAAAAARTVSLSLDAGPQQLVVAAGTQRATLRHGSDFICGAHGLRLLAPMHSGIDLGEVLVHRVDAFHTFSKAADGALLAATSIEEHATVGGVPLSGPPRQGVQVRWKAAARSGR